MPVIVPPGCAILATKWSATRSPVSATMGIVVPCPLQCHDGRNSNADNDVHPKAHKFSCEFVQPIFATLPKPILNENVLALYVAQIA